MSLSYLQPYAGVHAVQQATFLLPWAPLQVGERANSSEQLVEGLAAALASAGLSEVKPVEMMQLMFKPGEAPLNSNSKPSRFGYEGHRIGSNGTTPSLQVSATVHEGLVIHVLEYTRWADAFEQVRQLLRKVLPVASKVTPVLRAGLQVLDSFTWNGPIDQLPVASVFRKPSAWLPEHAFACRSFWHAHHGYFEKAKLPRCDRQLNNINVSVQGAVDRPLVQAALMHMMELGSGGWWMRDDSEYEAMDAVFLHLHAENKAAIGQLFSDELVERVKLWGNNGAGSV